jgi:hypothetical protein
MFLSESASLSSQHALVAQVHRWGDAGARLQHRHGGAELSGKIMVKIMVNVMVNNGYDMGFIWFLLW